MVLPKISETMVAKVESLITDFFWNGKKAKISLKLLQNNNQSGGLNLVNLRCKDASLKAGWVNLLLSNPDIANIVYVTWSIIVK